MFDNKMLNSLILNTFLSILCLIIIIYFIFTVYLKCKMPFWSKQPVFHIYNLFYWCRPPGLICPDQPLINKYVDLFNIKTYPLIQDEERNALIKLVCNFIKNNYIHNKDNINNKSINNKSIYSPSENNITEYLTASNHISYYTVYQEQKLLFNKNVPETSIDDIIAVISARPLYVRFIKSKQKTMFPTYYVDNLCVQPAYRKKNIASNMIQTHYYNLRKNNKRINTCLFKREGELNSIVPLVVFNTYCCYIKTVHNIIVPPNISLIEIGSSQLHLLVDFIKNQMSKFSCVILPDVTNITNLIKTKNLIVYALINKTNGQIISCYVFRLINLSYDGQKTIECISTLSDCIQELFINGFKMALLKLSDYDLILIEDTANTNIIINSMPSNSIKFISPTAFFFYNYACYSIKKNEFLIIY